MAIDLKKGGNINLAKEAPGLEKLRIGLGWDKNKFSTGGEFDLDVSAFVLKLVDGKTKLLSEKHMVFYNNLVSPEGAVTHSGDQKTGAASGDDETITVDLGKLPADVAEISFVVTIHDAIERKQNFGQVSNAYAKLYNDTTGDVLAQYLLTDDYSNETAMQFVSLYRDATGNWRFKAIGAGYEMGLQAFVDEYC